PQGLAPLLWESIHRQQSALTCECPALNPAPCIDWGCRKVIEMYNLWGAVASVQSSKWYDAFDEKLSAISDVAIQFTAVLKDEFIDGLWERSLWWTLLWQRVQQPQGIQEYGKEHSQRKAGYPSWSWAGWCGAVRIPKYAPGKALSSI